MRIDRAEILEFVRTEASHPMKTKELAHAMGVRNPDYPAFRDIVKQLIADGELVRLKRNRIGLASEMNIAVGKIQITRSGNGYLLRPDKEDVVIPAAHTKTALDGDQVMVRLTGTHRGQPSGSVIRVVERSDRNIVGVFHEKNDFCFVVPDSARFHRDLYIPPKARMGAVDGEKVVAKLVQWDDPHLIPQGKITYRLGYPGQPGVDMLTIIKAHDLPEAFPDEVSREAEEIASAPFEIDAKTREDHTRDFVYTIDPADAKDHDDAVSVERIGKGYRLGVHIADVSHFVRPGTAIDEEAFRRGNSVYLPGTVIPMIPELLSNDICSLRPNRRRLAYSVFIDFDTGGRMKSWRVADTIIKSHAKLAYEEVQALFDGGKVPARVDRVADNIRLARDLARLLNRQRTAQGSLDFDLPEAKIVMNAKGEVIELGHRIRLEAHRLVEEFMLAANQAVALEVFRKAQPMLYRVHDRPDQEKIENFAYMMGRLGLTFTASPQARPRDFSGFLDQVKDRPEADFINELMLRSMQKAVYQRANIGHFGLAFKHYTHFTSPIRRYPDLLVHRLLRALGPKGYEPEFANRVVSVIDNVGAHCSETERQAEAAEREAVKVKQVAYMAKRVGDEFEGVISGVAPFGFFVRLDGLGAEGAVRLSSIDDDYYQLDEKHYRVVGKRTGQVFRLGDHIKVGVLKVDTVKNEIELFLTDRPEGKKSKRSGGSNGRKNKRKRRGRGKRK